MEGNGCYAFFVAAASHRACLLVRSLACLVACGGGESVCHLCVSCFACLGCATRCAQGTVVGNGCFLLPLFRTGVACLFACLLAWWLAGGVGACAIFASAALPACDVPLEARKAQVGVLTAFDASNRCPALRWHTGGGFDTFRCFESMPRIGTQRWHSHFGPELAPNTKVV